MLKENSHRGQGVLVLPEAEAAARAGASNPDGSPAHEMLQAYVGDQYTVAKRRFYLRWPRHLLLAYCLLAWCHSDPSRSPFTHNSTDCSP